MTTERLSRERLSDLVGIIQRPRARIATIPKLEWRGDALFIGSVEFGHYTVYESAKIAAIGHGLGCDRWIGTFQTVEQARAAVETAVKEALGWPE